MTSMTLKMQSKEYSGA